MAVKGTTTTGDLISLDEVVCDGCGESMDGHKCPGNSVVITSGGSINSLRAGVGRKKKEDLEQCPHCKGRKHFSLGEGLEDLQCVRRQFLLDTGQIADPLQRPPRLVPSDLDKIAAWLETQPNLTYGRMEDATGTSGGYKPTPKPKKPRTGKADKSLEETTAAVEAEAAPNPVLDVEIPVEARNGQDEVDAEPKVSTEERRKARKAELAKQRRAKLKAVK